MKNNVTEMVFIIDRSGSMSGYESDTVGGFNAAIEKQKEVEGKVFVSTVFFDSSSRVIHDRIPLENVKPLTVSDYRVGGCTALIDALGSSIHHIENIHKYARAEDVPQHTIFMITTDGMENASSRYSSDKVKKMIEEKTKECGWEFIFVAADIDAVETAKTIGIRPERAVNYCKSSEGVRATYDAMATVACRVRCDSFEVNDEDWKDILTGKDKKKK